MAANEADVRERSTAVADRSEAKNWLQANQQYLSAALAEVRVLLQRHINRNKVRSGNADQSESDLPNVSYPDFRGLRPPALEVLSATFKLSTFERALLLLCAGVEFDAGLAALCGEAQGKAHPTNPTFGLALAALPGAHWSALSPAAPLRYWKLIRTETASSLTQSLLHIDERILHYLAGVQYVDDRLADYLVPVTVTSQPVASHQVLSDQIVSLWSRIPAGGVLPAIQLCGLDAAGKRAVAASACARLKLNLVAIPGDNLPVNTSEVSTLIRLWEREAALQACALLVECDDMDAVNDARAPSVTRLLTTLRAPVLFTRSDRWTPLQRLTVTLDVNKPTLEEQRQLWRETLQGVGEVDAGRLDLLTSQFDLSARTIREAGTEAIGRLAKPVEKVEKEEDLAFAVWDACRAQARPRLDDLGMHIEPAATWDDLVLPQPQREILSEMAAHVRQRTKVYHEWAFATKGQRGLGISALFAGASGTGKTMAAEVLAHELRLDLYRIDLSSVVSKYIGETEKNLRRIFDAADDGGVILLFDEADALFGKRSEVKDSHDRYANIEVSYLLQRIESYRGLAILTTNQKSALDTAFLRRIRFIVQFPFPDESQRAEIWRRIFPEATPTEGLDVMKLSRLNVAGGNIRNIALSAAFLAADAGEPVRMTHLLHAARSEYAKLEKTLTDAEIEGWIGGSE